VVELVDGGFGDGAVVVGGAVVVAGAGVVAVAGVDGGGLSADVLTV
jgi:hypothetical protein